MAQLLISQKWATSIIIATFHEIDEVPALYAPVVVRVDETNHIVGLASETAGPALAFHR